MRSTRQNALFPVDLDNPEGEGAVRTLCGINVLVGICRPTLRSPYSVTVTIPEAAEQDQEKHRLPADRRGEGFGEHAHGLLVCEWLALGIERQCVEYGVISIRRMDPGGSVRGLYGREHYGVCTPYRTWMS